MRNYSIAFALACTLAPVSAQQLLKPPLKNWAAPLYWAPAPGELDERQRGLQRDSPIAQAAGIFTAPGPMTFIAVTPCRVMDTRASQPFTGAFGPPSLAAYVTRQLPVPGSSCNIPATAGAYSLNVTVVPTGALSFLTVWPAGQPYPTVSTLNDPVSGGVIANAAIVVAGTSGAIQMVAGNPTDVIIDINGYYATPTDSNHNTAIGSGALANSTTGTFNTASGDGALGNNTTGGDNTATGAGALGSNTGGSGNTATGVDALYSNTTGGGNTATGIFALVNNTNGNNNTASGYQALQSNTSGGSNTASGYQSLQSNTTGADNTASGIYALQSNTTGGQNTASGRAALLSNTTGSDNTAIGIFALQNNTTGSQNAATGRGALNSNTTGSGNTASGYQALQNNTTGFDNAATGFQALQSNTTGFYNVASGYQALQSNTTGTNNVAIGYLALSNITAGGSNIAIGPLAGANIVNGASANYNIDIGNPGVTFDALAIRIGEQGRQCCTYIAGIYNQGVGSTNLMVCVDSTGRLGTGNCSGTPSSRRFKEQITGMGDASSKLLQLRPVTFLYKPEYDDGSRALQYGLIAEEVAKLYPDMVGYDDDGQPSSVKYQSLAPMLLNEVQKQNAQIRSLENRLAALEALLSTQTPAPARPLSEP
jgi:hypothetical protein